MIYKSEASRKYFLLFSIDPSVRNVEPPKAPNPWEKTVAKNEEKKKKKEMEEKKKNKKKKQKGFYSEEESQSESSSGTSDSER
jgi:hypothetical protein